MRCQCCGNYAPTSYVEFYQNIGALVARFSKSVKGELCKGCINTYFFKYTLTTAAIGWFGMISAIVTPCFIVNNTYYYFRSFGMKADSEPVAVPTDHPTLPALVSRVLSRPTPEALGRAAAASTLLLVVALGVFLLFGTVTGEESRSP